MNNLRVIFILVYMWAGTLNAINTLDNCYHCTPTISAVDIEAPVDVCGHKLLAPVICKCLVPVTWSFFVLSYAIRYVLTKLIRPLKLLMYYYRHIRSPSYRIYAI